MSLIYCPECGNEISNAAVACPNCGRPVNTAPVVERKVVIVERPREGGGFPAWAFIPLGILGAALLFVLFIFIARNNQDDANTSVNVNLDSARRQPSGNTTYTREMQTQSAPVTEPQRQPVSVPGSQSSVTQAPATKGTVMMEAKVVTRDGSQQAVSGQRFYLLDKDVETILTEAGVQPIAGQSLLNSYGLSVLYPGHYAEFDRNASRAIRGHIKYAGNTDAAGKAQLGGVEPNNYYVFGIAKVGNGFAVWSSPVSVFAGENVLNLSPQTINEIQNTAG
jgi:hypothetical protein